MPHDVFIAYASGDEAHAVLLHTELKKLGLSPFIDKDLLGGDNWDLKIPEALENSRIAVVLIGKTYNKAHYLRDEATMTVAYARQEVTAYRVVPMGLGPVGCVPTRGPSGARIPKNTGPSPTGRR